MAVKEIQLDFLEYLGEVLRELEQREYHHAKAGTHQAQLYSQVVQEITILNKK